MNDKWITRILFLAGVLWLVVVIVFAVRFALLGFTELSDSVDEWGQFGDYVGGLMNPAVALLALLLVAHGVRVQMRTMEQMRFDTQFTGLMAVLATVKQHTASQAMLADAARYIVDALTPEPEKRLTDKAVLSGLSRSSAAWEGILGVIRSLGSLIDSHVPEADRDRYFEIIRGLVTNDEAIIYLSLLEVGSPSAAAHATLIGRLDLVRYMNNPDRITIRNGFAEIRRKRAERASAANNGPPA
jgi:hypothetical protein